jgi:iron(III) transport system permease protein
MATSADTGAGRRSDPALQWAIRYSLPVVLIGLLLFLVVYPVGTLILASFLDTPPRPGSPLGEFTLINYLQLSKAGTLNAALNSLLFGVCGTLLALAIGSTLAWLLARTDVPGKAVVGAAGIMPLFMSSLVGALAYALIASPRSGYINLLLRDLGIPLTVDVYSGGGIVFVLALFYAPYSFLFMSSALQLMNPELEEAAEAHGASRTAVMRSVTFPLVKPAFLGAGILTLVLTLENFPVPQILGSPARIETMPSLIFRMMMQAPPRPTEAAAVGMLLLVVMVVLVTVQSRLLANRAFHTVTGKGFRPKLIPLGRWRWPAFGFAVCYLFFAVLLPVFALFQSALRAHPYIADTAALFDFSAFTMKHMVETLHYNPFQQAFVNSVMVGVLTAILGTGFHFILSYYVNRTSFPWRRTVEYVAMLPVALPALIIGMGFLWAWIAVPLPIYGTLLILVLAYTARFMPQGFRSVSSTILQVHRDLEDCAVVAGASRTRAVVDILAPLIRPGIAATMLLLFILSMRELSTSIFLFTSDTRVLAIIVYEQWEAGSWPRVASISLLYSAMLFVITIAGRKWIGLRDL